MKFKFIEILFLILVLIGTCCSKNLITEEFTNDAIGNYDAVWSEFDRNYGAFEAKKINWDSLYFVYRAQLNNNSSDQELYNAVTGLIANLNDGHVTLTASGFKLFISCKNNLRPHFPDSKEYESTADLQKFFNLITTKYLSSPSYGTYYISGFIKNSFTIKNIGYLYISTFVASLYPEKAIDDAMKKFENADAIILDLRFNGGGATETLLHLLEKFADKRRFFLQSKLRNGLGEKDFTKIYKHYFSPAVKAFTPKPVMLLVNKFTASSSEHVFLGMKTLPYITSLGDSTCGALSTVQDKLMPNGWQFRCCPQVLLDTTGKYLSDSKGRYPDGFGFAPDIRVINTLAEIISGYDGILKKAVDIINKK